MNLNVLSDKQQQQILRQNKIKETINQTDLVLITLSVLTSKERNSKKVSPKQNAVRQKNKYVKILIDSGASASIIHKSYINKNNLLQGKPPRINGSQ